MIQEASLNVPVVYVQGMSMSLNNGHLPSWAKVEVLVSVCAQVPLMIRYAPEFTILQTNILKVIFKTH